MRNTFAVSTASQIRTKSCSANGTEASMSHDLEIESEAMICECFAVHLPTAHFIEKLETLECSHAYSYHTFFYAISLFLCP